MHSLTINLLPSDYRGCNVFLQRRMRENSWVFWWISVAGFVKWVPAILGLMGLYWSPSSNDIDSRSQAHTIFYFFVAYGVINALCNWAHDTWQVRSHCSATERFASPCTLTLSGDGARLEGVWGNTTLRWSAFDGIAVFDHVLYLIVHPSDAWIVPKSAFADNDEYRSFAEYARRCIGGASA